MSSTRRGFLATAAVSAVPASAKRGLKFFTEDEAKLVEALCEQIVPRDKDPGAKDAGVVYYIDKQLLGPLKRFGKHYKAGLVAMNATVDFLKLPFDKQTEFLKSMEAGEVRHAAWSSQPAHSFFNMVVDHTMQGFYGSPKHGGNRGEASWKMLGVQKVMHEEHQG
jgi:gluconate 2-dehydrogenase gamma chain